MSLFSQLLILVVLAGAAHAGIFDSMYCGRDNCYEIMGVEPTATKKEVNKAYRKLAKELHPDRNKAEDAHQEFEKLVAAYETLKNDDTRRDYDYLLDNPDIYYEHFYRFFRTSTPKVDITPIVVVSLAVISLLHYLHRISSYNRALDWTLRVPTYRNQAKALAESEGLLNKKFFKGMPKDEQRETENKILRDIIESKLDIKGGYKKPEWIDILAIQLLMLPFKLGQVVYFHARRLYKYKLRGEDPDDEEKWYRTRVAVGLSSVQWEGVPDEKKDSLYLKELWHEENRIAYIEEKEEKKREAQANSNKYKIMKRMQRKDKCPENYND